MIGKHPTGKVVNSKELLPMNTALKTSTECILKEIASFAAGSSPGRSALRFEHLREAFNYSVPIVAQNCLQSFTSVVNHFLPGTAPSAASKYICGANLSTLSKNSDTILLIAVGEIIRRIVSKVACSSVLSSASKLVAPHQVGIGVPAVCESVIHSVRVFLKGNDHRDDMAVLLIDFTKAFNLIDRQTFINDVKTKLRAYTTGLVYCYGKESLLDYDGFTIQSSFGVKQGDPLVHSFLRGDKGLSKPSRRRPVDIFIPNWAHGSPAAVDVTTTCPMQSTVINGAAEEVGYACKLAEERTLAASAELRQQSGFEIIPLALETSGGFVSSATSFLTVLAVRCADNNVRDRAAEKHQLFQRINVAVHRLNANMVQSRVPLRELEPGNMRFCREKPPFTTCRRLRDDISEEGPLAKTPLCSF